MRIPRGGRFLEVWGERSRNCLNSLEKRKKMGKYFHALGSSWMYVLNFSLAVTFWIRLEVLPSGVLSNRQNNWVIGILTSERQSIALAFSSEDSFKAKKFACIYP